MSASTSTAIGRAMAEWNQLGLDRLVRGSQYYINACRSQMDMPEIYWSSSLHEVSVVVVMHNPNRFSPRYSRVPRERARAWPIS